MSWTNYKDKLKRYFWFSGKELKEFIIVVLVFGFILSFNQWGEQTFNLSQGINSLVIGIIIVGLSLFAHHAVQRMASLAYGFQPLNKMWLPGIIICIIVLLATKGKLMIFAATSFWIQQMKLHRLGWYRYGPNVKHLGRIAFFSILANILIAAIAYVVFKATGSAIANEFVIFNLMFAGYNLLPLPPLDGSRIFYASRMLYIFAFTGFLAYVLLTALAGLAGIMPILIAIGVGIACMIAFFAYFEMKW